MVKGIKIILINGALVFGLYACNKTTPSGFWLEYQKGFLIANNSNQGIKGGYRSMYWKAEKKFFFNAQKVIEFAEKQGWQFVDSIEVQANELTTWNYNNKPIFPLDHTRFSPNPRNNNSTYEHFPRWIKTGLKVYKFKTNWLAFDPGTDNSNEVNGFVVLSNELNEMSVYHLWGE